MNTVSADIYCAVCGTSSVFLCERCQEPYCSRECQNADWRRHKFYCIPMPVLVPNKYAQGLQEHPLVSPKIENPSNNKEAAFVSKPVKSIESASSVDSLTTAIVKEKKELSSVWRETFLPPQNDFFECRVTYMKSDGVLCVVDVANIELMERFNENMQRVKPKLSRAKCVEEDSLVVVQGEKKLHRGQVLSMDRKSETAQIYLIDHGSVVTSSVQEIYDPVSRIADKKAFAIQVKLLSNTGVQTNKHLTLRLLGPKTQEGIYSVQLKPKMTIPLNLPIELLQMSPEVTVARILEGCLQRDEKPAALLQISTINQINDAMDDKLNGKPDEQQPISLSQLDTCTTIFLAAYTKQGYRRAFLLDLIDAPPKRTFLVYEMDEGRISITTDVRRIPSELLGHPIQTFAMKLNDEMQQPPLEQLVEDNGPDFTVKLRLKSIQGQEKVRKASAALLSKGKQLGEVELTTFMGDVSCLGHKYWRETIKNGTMVRITYNVGYKQVFISSMETLKYASLFKRMEKKCKPFEQSDQITIGSIVLVASPKLGYFRGEISGEANDLFHVYNIDTGETHQVEAQFLRMSCRFLRDMPVSLSCVKLKSVCDIPECAVNPINAGCQLMKEIITDNVQFRVEFVGSSTEVVDLYFCSGEQTSLTLRMLPLMFKPVSMYSLEVAASDPAPASAPAPAAAAVSASAAIPEGLKDKTTPPAASETVEDLPPLPPSPPVSPAIETKGAETLERFYYKDVPKILIPLGKRVNAFLLNGSGLHQTGAITACHFKDVTEAESYQKLFYLVDSLGKCSYPDLIDYVPCIDEMVLAVFSEDNNWYRGVCEEILGDKARIFFCDYGNHELVSMKKLKPLSSNLMQGINATKCYIEGFDNSEKFSLWEKHIKTEFNILCNVEEGPDSYSRTLTILDLDKIVSQNTS
ncbi:uncharacterized protein Kots [Drosophila pseudoobscura]|uniref:Uncharacterized protein Kots n=2 Tax=Drosophila pseudoobscura TaxID=7237 RepID=A0A6I8UPB4_DROPS|nr:uncharacterized protein LOC4801648 [Drosophila pseudoobscura]